MDVYLDPPGAVEPLDMNQYRLDKLRLRRDQMLQDSDWTQMSDAPFTDDKRAEWRTYRQTLRDLPASVGDTVPQTVTFPDKPS